MVEWCNDTVDHGNPVRKLYGECFQRILFGDIESIKCDSECSSDSTNDFCGRLNNVLFRWFSGLDII